MDTVRGVWILPVSNTDLRAIGHKRLHECACTEPGCPRATLERVEDVARRKAGEVGWSTLSAAPLLPNAMESYIAKKHMANNFQELGKLVGVTAGITGHAARVSEAKRMARAGHLLAADTVVRPVGIQGSSSTPGRRRWSARTRSRVGEPKSLKEECGPREIIDDVAVKMLCMEDRIHALVPSDRGQVHGGAGVRGE